MGILALITDGSEAFLVFTAIIMIRPTGVFGEKTVNRA